MTIDVDCIIPVYNEEDIASLVEEIESASTGKYRLYVTLVDDKSEVSVAQRIQPSGRIQMIQHPENLGNGAAIRTGLLATRREYIVLMDGDGQHDPRYLEGLLDGLESNDLVIASRENWANCSLHRAWANRVFCRLASWLLGREVPDITSGFRAFKRSSFYRVFPLFPNKFSSPITLVLLAYLMNRAVGYYPITVRHRSGTSKIRIFHDGLTFMHSVLKIGILANPLKFFYVLAGLLSIVGMLYAALISVRIGRLFIPGGATIVVILAGLSLVIAHLVDFAKIILVLILRNDRLSDD